VVLAEVYPSLLAPRVATEGGIKDQAQVRLLARALLRMSVEDKLSPLFTTPQAPVTTEEGWVLGAGFESLLAEAAE
jgi:molybdopterin-guanine dinucleotide biosynthesis protein B